MNSINPTFQTHDNGENNWSEYRGTNTEPDQRSASKAIGIFLVAILVLGLGALAYFGYLTWNKQNIQPREVLGTQRAVGALGQRVDIAEAKLHELTGGWEGVGQRVAKLEAKVEGNLSQSRNYADTLTQQLHRQIIAEMNARTSVLDTRLRQVESEQADQRSQMAQLQVNLQQEIQHEVATVREDTGRDLSGVREQTETNSRSVSALSQRLDRERIDFELAKGQTKELVPGITLQISGTNPTYQRYRGSLWLLKDRRTLWLREQSVHEPVRFFHKEGGEPYELIITDVTNKAAVGYLLIPVQQDIGDSPSAQQAAISVPGHE